MTRATIARALGWIAAALLAWPPARSRAPTPAPGLAARLLGPVASLAASAEWVRFDLAWQRGRREEAYAHAERMLALDPSSESAWIAFALHLARDRASVALEPDPRRRRAWIEEGLLVLRRGEARVRHPEELLLTRGLVLAQVAWSCAAGEGAPDWPGGARAAAESAIAAFRAAAELGHPAAGEQAQALERWVESLEGG